MNKRKKILSLAAGLILAGVSAYPATLMQYDIGIMTSGGSALNGTFYFVSYGVDGILNSNLGSLAPGSTSLLAGDDKWLFAGTTTNGTSGGNWTEYYNVVTPGQYVSGAAVGQKFGLFFVNGLTSTQLNLANGSLLTGFSIGATGAGGGTSFSYGTYRTDSNDTGGGNVADSIAWFLPSNSGATASVLAFSGSGPYLSDFNANLTTSSSFTIIPEPSTGALMMIGAVGLVALRRLRKF